MKIAVIGAGIAGLSAAILAQKAGFSVTVFEQHFVAGGLSQSWSRGGYFFEGGMHWLTGSSQISPVHRFWKEVGALSDETKIFYRDPSYVLKTSRGDLCLYRNPEKLRQHFLEFAPEDKKAIQRFYRDIKTFSLFKVPIKDVFGLKTNKKCRLPLSFYFCAIPAGINFLRLSRISTRDYIRAFKNPDIRNLLSCVVNDEYCACSMIFTLASFAVGDSGYPEGGSAKMVSNMCEKLKNLGGKIEFKNLISKIVVKNKKACGVIAKNAEGEKFFESDAVICTQDSRVAIISLFEKPVPDAWCKKLIKSCVSEQNMFACFGIRAELKNYPPVVIFALENPLLAGGLQFFQLRINNYANYKGYSPQKTTTLTMLLLGQSYDYWKMAMLDGTYRQKKEDVIKKITAILEEKMPETRGKIEVTDFATPITYERYCSSFEGSWMTIWQAKKALPNYPQKSKYIKNLYFASQRLYMAGGLPIALLTARKAVQLLCRDTKTIYIQGV